MSADKTEKTREELLAENASLSRMPSWATAPVRPAQMSMREFYKSAALQGWAAGRNSGAFNVFTDSDPLQVSRACGRYADAMLAEDEEHAKK